MLEGLFRSLLRREVTAEKAGDGFVKTLLAEEIQDDGYAKHLLNLLFTLFEMPLSSDLQDEVRQSSEAEREAARALFLRRYRLFMDDTEL